ncbi:MAG: xanthine dehydrogenase family protein molybdopterin-binding subunit, partial [Nitrososphaerales archaeon]
VAAVITCMDDQTIWNAGERVHKRRLFTDHVRFVGDSIGAVAATTRNIAQEASELVQVEYDELPSVFTIADSLKPNAPKIWEDGNVLGPHTFGFGDLEAAFSKADLILEGDYITSRVHNSPLEPATSLAWWEDDKLTVVAGSQNVMGTRDGIAKDLNLPASKVRVITLYKGGGFGNKNNSMNHDLMAALLAKKTGKPVMMEYSRADDFTGIHGRWSSNQHLRMAVDTRTGKIIAGDQTAHCDVGGYTRHVMAGNFVDGAESYYSTEAWSGKSFGIYTNTSATGHMRAPTGPQACFAAETLVDEIAHKLRLDPMRFRLNNRITKHEGVENFTSNGMEDCLIQGAEIFGWKQKWQRPPDLPKGKIARGVGVAIATWHSRYGKGEAILALKKDGSVELTTSVVDIGTGAKSVMAIIAADALGIDLEDISVVWGDSDLGLFAIGESGSRTTNYTGIAVKDTALKLRNKILELASSYFKVSPSELTIEHSRVIQNGSTWKYIELSKLMEFAKLDELRERGTSEPVFPEGQTGYSFAAHFAEVEVDLETGKVSVLKYVAAHDSGTIINHLLATSQVQGGVVMGMGMALSERLLINPDYGMIQNASFYTYRLPNITSIPKIEAVFIQTKDPFGTKGLGELPLVPVPAVIGNAIFNATSLRLRSLPFTPEGILRASGSLAV